MSAYAVELLRQAADDLAALDPIVAGRIGRKLQWLGVNFSDVQLEPLTGDLKGLFKLRVGSYRAIYSIYHDRRVIVVHLIGHRRDIYES
jgi:mRNA interferase RelE/StbE